MTTMTAANLLKEKIAIPMGHAPAPPKPISWKVFEKKYLSREDNFKYEWVNGLIEKTERTMNQYQDLLADNLIQFFYKLKFANKLSGRLTKEVDTFFLPKVHRHPDLLWFSDEQSFKIAKGENQVPAFVIEVISKNDQITKVNKKLKNYEDAGVEVVWLVFPELEEVQIFHGAKSVIYRGKEVISAAPALPVFEMPVEDIFKMPVKN